MTAHQPARTTDPAATPRRVAVLIDRYPPILGGAQNNVHQLCRSLVERGWSVTVLTRRLDRKLLATEELDGVRVHRLGWSPVRIMSKWWCGWRAFRWLCRHRDEIDVVLTAAIGRYSDLLAAHLAWRWTKIPYVLRGSSLGNNFGRLLGDARGLQQLERIVAPRSLWRAALNGAAAITVQSPVIQEEAHRFGFKARVIPNGVDTERFSPRTPEQRTELRNRLGLPEHRVIAVYVARYVHQKNQQVLIEAAEQIERGPRPGRLSVLIVGTTESGQVTSNEHQLKQYVQQRGLGKLVHFVDNVANVEDYLGASDIFVFPSKFPEGMSNALLEAMAAGLPVLASNAPQIRCMLPEGMDSLFDPDDVTDLAKRLDALVDDRPRRQREGATLAAWARQHYARQRQEEIYTALLSSIAGRGAATASPKTPA